LGKTAMILNGFVASNCGSGRGPGRW
jgi:hypothetical protein